ncbi:uncharacterized protein ACIB01_017284 [Guaruba guarouba]
MAAGAVREGSVFAAGRAGWGRSPPSEVCEGRGPGWALRLPGRRGQAPPKGVQQDRGGSSLRRERPGAAESPSPSSLQGAPEHPSRERSRLRSRQRRRPSCGTAGQEQAGGGAERGKLRRLKRSGAGGAQETEEERSGRSSGG